MNWKKLQDIIYYRDGSFRDIYVSNTTQEDWKLWTDYVNRNYKTTVQIYENKKIEETIDFDKMRDYWGGVTDNCMTATVFLGDIKVNAHFFDDSEIENDITPSEINSIDDHNRLMDYMKAISVILRKKVILTPEDDHETILISVDNDQVVIGSD